MFNINARSEFQTKAFTHENSRSEPGWSGAGYRQRPSSLPLIPTKSEVIERKTKRIKKVFFVIRICLVAECHGDIGKGEDASIQIKVYQGSSWVLNKRTKTGTARLLERLRTEERKHACACPRKAVEGMLHPCERFGGRMGWTSERASKRIFQRNQNIYFSRLNDIRACARRNTHIHCCSGRTNQNQF